MNVSSWQCYKTMSHKFSFSNILRRLSCTGFQHGVHGSHHFKIIQLSLQVCSGRTDDIHWVWR
jgi:hypothetical protein